MSENMKRLQMSIEAIKVAPCADPELAQIAMHLVNALDAIAAQIEVRGSGSGPARGGGSAEPDLVTMVRELFEVEEDLNEWEQKFIGSVKGRDQFSDKQSAVIRKTYKKVCEGPH